MGFNLYPVQFGAIFDVKTLLKILEMALDQDLICQIFPLRGARFPILTGRMANAKILRWGPNATYNPLARVGDLCWGNANFSCFLLGVTQILAFLDTNMLISRIFMLGG